MENGRNITTRPTCHRLYSLSMTVQRQTKQQKIKTLNWTAQNKQ
jgi:hypothetical protein